MGPLHLVHHLLMMCQGFQGASLPVTAEPVQGQAPELHLL